MYSCGLRGVPCGLFFSFRRASRGAEENRAFQFQTTSSVRRADLERREGLRLFKAEMGTPARDDFYEALRLARS